MAIKNFIAALLVTVFLGKMLTIDAKFLEIIFDASQVTLVNKLCPKTQFSDDTSEDLATATFSSSFEYDFLCHIAFDVHLIDSNEALTENNFRKYNYRDPGNFSTPGDRFYPPPKS